MTFVSTARFVLLGSAATLLATAAAAQTESVIYSFPYYTGVYSRLYEDSTGKLYGTDYYGAGVYGSVFSLGESKGVWSENQIFKFDGHDGAKPAAGVAVDANGDLAGTTAAGGTHHHGTVFLLSPTGKKTWSQSVLYDFSGGSDGSRPLDPPLVSKTGAIYSTASTGGYSNCGTVIDLTESNGNWTESTLYSFQGGSDGCTPQIGLHPSNKEGKYFGTTEYGGSDNYGTLYELQETRGVWSEKVEHSFSNGSDGGYPADIDVDTQGNYYGVANSGGANGDGIVYEWVASAGKFSVLYNFAGGNDGETPVGIHYDRTTGILYGTTEYGGTNDEGTVFKMVESGGTWTESVLHSFGGGTDGAYPQARAIEDPTTGDLYGTTAEGGADDNGTVWQLTP